MAAARFAPIERVNHNQLGHLHKVRDAHGLLQALVNVVAASRHVDILPECGAQRRNQLQGLEQTLFGAPHAAVVPHDLAQFAVEIIHRALALDLEQFVHARLRRCFGFLHLGALHVYLVEFAARQIVGERVGNDKVAVGQPLHERARAQTIGAVVAEVGLAQHKEAGDAALQVVIHPQTAHDVVERRIDAHGRLVGVLACNALVHVEEVAVAVAYHPFAQPFDGVCKVQIDAVLQFTHTVAGIHHYLGGA